MGLPVFMKQHSGCFAVLGCRVSPAVRLVEQRCWLQHLPVSSGPARLCGVCDMCTHVHCAHVSCFWGCLSRLLVWGLRWCVILVQEACTGRLTRGRAHCVLRELLLLGKWGRGAIRRSSAVQGQWRSVWAAVQLLVQAALGACLHRAGSLAFEQMSDSMQSC